MINEYFTRFYDELIKFFTLDMSSPTEFAGQLVGFIPLILSFITFSLAKREHILVSKTKDFRLKMKHTRHIIKNFTQIYVSCSEKSSNN